MNLKNDSYTIVHYTLRTGPTRARLIGGRPVQQVR